MAFLSGQTIIIIIITACILYYLHQFLRKKSHEYSSKSYWEGRYGLFSKRMDWYTNYAQLNRDFNIDDFIKKKYPSNTYKKRILEMGCGNSTLSYDLYNSGFKNITAIDFSENIINKMREYYKGTSINFQICDFNFMNIFFEQNFFDIIIEKAGLDSIATKGQMMSLFCYIKCLKIFIMFFVMGVLFFLLVLKIQIFGEKIFMID